MGLLAQEPGTATGRLLRDIPIRTHDGPASPRAAPSITPCLGRSGMPYPFARACHARCLQASACTLVPRAPGRLLARL